MEAKVRDDHRWPTVRAFGGHEYIKSEWRLVPEGLEAEAERLEGAGLLEVRDVPGPEPNLAVTDYTDIAAVTAIHTDSPIEEMTYNQLKRLASEMALGNTTGMKKVELLATVQAALEVDEEE